MPVVGLDEFLSSKFDFLVVGGGTSGLAIACRIAERTSFTVGVVEAGKHHVGSPLVDVPGMITKTFGMPDFDWAFTTAPEIFGGNRQIYLPRGKGLGGSSLINFFGLLRPAKEEMDAFEKLGNPRWNWNDTFFPFVKKSERLMPPTVPLDKAEEYGALANKEYHGTDGHGPIARSNPPFVSEIHVPILSTLEKLGIPKVLDNSGGRPVGCFLINSSIDSKTSIRSSSESGYYRPNSERKNLIILTEAQVSKIKFVKERDSQKATHANIIHGGKSVSIEVSKEIILSAGSYQTPQLLELSGIGNAEHLKNIGVDCLFDLPGVGENLQDHTLIPVIAQVDQSITSVEILADPERLKEQQELYKQQKGLLAGSLTSSFAFVPATIFINQEKIQDRKASKSKSTFLNKTPDSVIRGFEKQYEMIREWISDSDQAFGGLFHFNGAVPAPDFVADPCKRYMSFYCVSSHPFSRGSVHATSSDIMDQPTIRHNYFSDPVDLDMSIKLVSFALKAMETSPLSDKVIETVVPKVDPEDYDGIREHAIKSFGSCYHPVGTASMLPLEDGGVVDSDLKVYGTTNLRVVDCSIIPLIISCNIQSLAYVIAEKAADLIVNDHSRGTI